MDEKLNGSVIKDIAKTFPVQIRVNLYIYVHALRVEREKRTQSANTRAKKQQHITSNEKRIHFVLTDSLPQFILINVFCERKYFMFTAFMGVFKLYDMRI